MRKKIKTKSPVVTAACGLMMCLPAAGLHASELSTNSAPPTGPAGMDIKVIPFDTSLFLSDPTYADRPYDPAAQLDIYGGKHAVNSTRPLLELGRELFTAGAFSPLPSYLGEKNLIYQHLWVYGDWRTAGGYDDTGTQGQHQGVVGPRSAVVATRVDLDVDYQFTATERIHAFFRPFEHNGDVSRVDFGNTDLHGRPRFDGTPLALFFEGDAARIWSGFTDKDNRADIPFAAGLMPMVIQNGIWLQSAFTGAAVTIPAQHSSLFKVSNMDVTFFAGLANVNTAAIALKQGEYSAPNAQIYGVASFIEANQGYWEADYGYTAIGGDFQGRGLDYHNVSLAFTRRYFDLVSDSIRVIGNFGQEPQPASTGRTKTSEGTLFLCENSFVTPLEITLIPYANFFLGVNTPNSLARDPGAGGVLVNTGINFETDGLTGFPNLDASGHDTYGGALGLEYLFNLDQQLVLELATVQILDDSMKVTALGRTAPGAQYAIGARYQIPLSRSWIFRTDAIAAIRQNTTDLDGIRFELRYKF